jgi:hypothetical protein
MTPQGARNQGLQEFAREQDAWKNECDWNVPSPHLFDAQRPRSGAAEPRSGEDVAWSVLLCATSDLVFKVTNRQGEERINDRFHQSPRKESNDEPEERTARTKD